MKNARMNLRTVSIDGRERSRLCVRRDCLSVANQMNAGEIKSDRQKMISEVQALLIRNGKSGSLPWFTFLALALLLLLPQAAHSQSVLTDDSDVNCLLPLNGCGTGVSLSLAPEDNVYVKFKLSSTLPAGTSGASVARATLKLYINNVTGAGALDVYQVSGPWSEKTITAGNAPPLGVLIATGIPIQTSLKGQFLVLDVTPAVKQWLGTDGSGEAGSPNYGVALVASNGARVAFDSKENPLTSHEPQLNVQLSSSGSVTSVSADGPLTVTDATTTPHISLGVVPTTLGGTGLSSAGVSGNFLRSDGGMWTSAALSASDFPAGNSNYIQNSSNEQTTANFNIGGTGSANILNAAKQFNIGGIRVLTVEADKNNVFTGFLAGNANTTGISNSFFGHSAGQNNTAGSFNSFFGFAAGAFNTTGISNTITGNSAGTNNLTGNNNAFFGFGSGHANTTGHNNSIFGSQAGFSNTGSDNSFVGMQAGGINTTGSSNSFFGKSAGSVNTTGGNLTLIGANANVGTNGLNFATAIGAGALVNSSNTIVLGRSADTVQVPGALNIAGSFGASSLNAATQFNLGGGRVLAAPGTGNLVGGIGAGATLTTGQNNTFFGASAGQSVTAATGNSFFGRDTGKVNTGGVNNSFFGDRAGATNTTGNFNSFYGEQAGVNNTTGASNTFIGRVAGINNTTGTNNTFIGVGAGNAGFSTQVSNSTAIGAGATVSTSNTIAIGTIAQTTMLSGGVAKTFNLGTNAPYGIIAGNLIFKNLNIFASDVPVCMRLFSLGSDGGWALTQCASSAASARYKTDAQPFAFGLDVIKRLQPVTFSWKEDGHRDVGLNAEDVAAVEPLLVRRNEAGEVEDVKAGAINVLFINAFKQQQQQIEAQQQQLKQQQQQLDGLRKLVCLTNSQTDLCKEKLVRNTSPMK